MAWQPVSGQVVVAHLDGKVRQVLVTAWNPYTRAVKVSWPPKGTAAVSHHRFPVVRNTEIGEASYEPLDPHAFREATEQRSSP